ncbi:MAG: hypothetical protein JW728_06610 [Candidatus Aureabacteria bacterium]|nr:hypothetical protein [Candidatus Auribacterota bacterium]
MNFAKSRVNLFAVVFLSVFSASHAQEQISDELDVGAAEPLMSSETADAGCELIAIPGGDISETEYILLLTKIREISDNIPRDRILMQNGITMEGRILEENREYVKISVNSNLMKIFKDRIKEITPMPEQDKEKLIYLYNKKVELVNRFDKQQQAKGLVKFKGKWISREDRKDKELEDIRRKAELKAERAKKLKDSNRRLTAEESRDYLSDILDELIWDDPENPPFRNAKDAEIVGNKLLEISKRVSRGYYSCMKLYFKSIDLYIKAKNSPTVSTQKRYLKEANKIWQSAETDRRNVDETISAPGN